MLSMNFQLKCFHSNNKIRFFTFPTVASLAQFITEACWEYNAVGAILPIT